MILKTLYPFFRQLSFSVILGTAFGFLFAGYMVLAFSEPALDPTAGNTDPPLDQSDAVQFKDGVLKVNMTSAADTGLRVYEGYTQIDLTSFTEGNVCGSGSGVNGAGRRGRMAFNPTTNALLFCTGTEFAGSKIFRGF